MRPKCSAAAGAAPLPEGMAAAVQQAQEAAASAGSAIKGEDPMKSHKIVERLFKGIREDIKRKVCWCVGLVK